MQSITACFLLAWTVGIVAVATGKCCIHVKKAWPIKPWNK